MKKSLVRISSVSEELDETFLCRGAADLSATGVSAVYSFMLCDITSGFSVQDKCYEIQGEIIAQIIYGDIRGEICFAEKMIPYEYKGTITEIDGEYRCEPHCTICAGSYVINDDSRLDVRAEINVRGLIFREKDVTAVTDLTVNRDRVKSTDTASLTVYFADKGEVLWDIAEKYNTTIDRIVKENSLTETVLKENCRLLIPKI